MCTPTIAIGALIGGGVGYAAGGKRGALLGALGGGFGGYALGGLGGAAAGVGASGIPFAAPLAVLPGGGIGGGLITVGGATGAGAVGGGGIFGSLGSFFTSPGFNLGSQLIGFGVQMAGMQQQAAFQRAQIAFQQAALRNRQIVAEQGIKARQERLREQERIIGAQGAQARGQLRAEQAGRGVLVDVGSAADATQQLAGDVAFAKLIKEQETALQDRQDRIIASGLATDSALLDFQRAEGQRASVFGQAGAGLKLAAGFSKFRWSTGGQLEFRT